MRGVIRGGGPAHEATERTAQPRTGAASLAVSPQNATGPRAWAPPRREELPSSVGWVLTRIAVGDPVGPAAIAEAFRASVELRPPTRDVVLGSLMTAVMTRGPLVDDVELLLRAALTVESRRCPEMISGDVRPVLMLAGSGKKGQRTLNVSTPAALVAAAAGAQVIKVGSAATSSALGSRELVRALGLPEHRTARGVRAGLAESGFAFVAVEPEIPVLDRVYGGRFHAPNPFSFGLAPLASPIRADITVFGLAHPRVDVAAVVLSRFGMDRVDVLSTRLAQGGYLDEIGLAGQLLRCRVRKGRAGPVDVESAELLAPACLPSGLPTPSGAAEAIERTIDLLAGRGPDSHRALVAVNAAHLLVLSGLAASLPQGRDLAEDVLRSGDAMVRNAAPRRSVLADGSADRPISWRNRP